MKAKKRFWRMLCITCRLNFKALTMPFRSPLTSVMPALSMATSVPVPMATPTSASARAGASFFRRVHFSADIINAQLRGDGLGGHTVVSGEHNDFQAQTVQSLDGRRRCRLDRISDPQNPKDLALLRHPHGRLRLCPHLRRFLLKVPRHFSSGIGNEFFFT